MIHSDGLFSLLLISMHTLFQLAYFCSALFFFVFVYHVQFYFKMISIYNIRHKVGKTCQAMFCHSHCELTPCSINLLWHKACRHGRKGYVDISHEIGIDFRYNKYVIYAFAMNYTNLDDCNIFFNITRINYFNVNLWWGH